MEITFHANKRLTELGISAARASTLAPRVRYGQSAAYVIARLDKTVCLDIDAKTNRNGDLVVGVIRDNRLVCVFPRRSDQPWTPEALRVDWVA